MMAPELLERYAHRFAPNRDKYYERKNVGWRPAYHYPGKRPKRLSMDDIHDHVVGCRDYPIGIPLKGEMDFLILDYDDHPVAGKHPGLENLNNRMAQVHEVLGVQGIIVSTATGNGRQEIVPTNRLPAEVIHASVTKRLTDGGLAPRDGFIEVRTGTHNTRLPHGPPDCKMINPKTQRIIEDRRVSLSALNEALENWDSLPKLKLMEIASSHDDLQHTLKPVKALSPNRAQFYWDHGLQENGSRYTVCHLLVRDCLAHGLTPAQATERVWTWLKTKHNGQSSRMMTKPDDCYGTIRWWAYKFDMKKQPFVPAEEYRSTLESYYGQMRELGRLERDFCVELGLLCVIQGLRTGTDGVVVQAPKKILMTYDKNYRSRLDSLAKKGVLWTERKHRPPPRIGVAGEARTYRLQRYPDGIPPFGN